MAKVALTYTGTPASFDGLASTQDLEIQSITIKSTTVDAGNDPTTDLRKYMLLAKDSSTGKYVNFDATTHESSVIVVLFEDIYSIDEGDQTADAVFAGTFKSGVLIDNGETVTWTEVQRIKVRNE